MNKRAFTSMYGAIAAVLLGALPGCTDLSLAGDEQLRCRENAECPSGLQCAPALQRCVSEAVAAELPIAIDGDVSLDVVRLSRIEGFSVSTIDASFTKPPVSTTALFDNRVAVPCVNDNATLHCTLDARELPDEVDGDYDIVVSGVDAAGNEARGRVRVTLDTLAPVVPADSAGIRYEPTTTSLVREPVALGPTTRAIVQFSVTEAATDVTLQLTDDDGSVLADGVRDDARSAGLLQVFVFDAVNVPDGAYTLVAHTTDSVGNVGSTELAVGLVVDATAPGVADVDTEGRVLFRRAPWGTRAQPTPSYTLEGDAGAVEAGGLVVVTADAALSSSLLATVAANADGSFSTPLQPLDIPRVFMRVLDGAGNIGEAVAVRDMEWTASLGGRVRSDDFSNPHALFTTGAFDLSQLQLNLQNEPRRPGDLVDGDGFTIDAVGRRINVRTQATGQPSRLGSALGYLPTLASSVIFGGAPGRGQAVVTDTLVRREGQWQSIAFNPPATGPLVYDSVHEELVSLIANGELWAFDGATWRQRPATEHPAMAGGPLAFDQLQERFVTVQGSSTWTLGVNDTDWTQLADAPVSAMRAFDGVSAGTGGVLAFDGVDGVVLLYGTDSAGSGGVYALVDDNWSHLGSAPAVRVATAVEDPFTGRVHFVCRNDGSGNVGAMLTWDGASMQSGAVDPDPRIGCGAVVDIAEGVLLAHGGTFDSRIDVQSLPSPVINVLDVGTNLGLAWRTISAAAPTPLTHNSAGGPSQAGTAHYNPERQQMVMHAAYTGAITSRGTTLWRGEDGISAGNLTGLRPFFDGEASRLVEGSSERVLVNDSWQQRTLSFTAPFDASFVFDEGEDAAIGFGGFFNGAASNDTYRLRGASFVVLSPTTRPPARLAPAVAYDAANARVVLAGGHDSLFSPLHDVWAFEQGDWRQLPDLPLGAADGDVQLLFDRARNVLVAFVLGTLFDLRDDAWVEVDVDVDPRADALAMFDETTQRLLFVGGLNFEQVLKTIAAYDLAGSRAGAAVRFDLRAAGASAGAVYSQIDLDMVAGGRGSSTTGVRAAVWGNTSFVELGSNTASPAAPELLHIERSGVALGAALRDTLIVALHSEPSGVDVAPAQLRLTQAELTLRYREP